MKYTLRSNGGSLKLVREMKYCHSVRPRAAWDECVTVTTVDSLATDIRITKTFSQFRLCKVFQFSDRNIMSCSQGGGGN